jgi:DNA-directed RNA polymerase specialized sigma24 family protein
MDNPKNEDLLKELRRITKLLVLIATKDQKQKDQIRLLDSMKFQPKEIAELLGTTSNTVNVALHSMRKKGKLEKAKKEQPSN